ncbi:MAG: 3-keto-disaccharide hydrolase, partial [Flavobacteriales bacterium]
KEGGFHGVISKRKKTFIGGRGEKKSFEMKKIEHRSPYLNLRAPEGADILYDGNGFDKWQDPTGWVELDKNVMMVTPDAGYLISKKAYTDVTLHVEFRLSYMPNSSGQSRSNSGVFISDEYEVQVLDSFGLDGLYDECGALYKTSAPRVNATYPPLEWQTYDIVYKNAVYDEATKTTIKPTITVWHNGVLIHANEEIPWVPGYSAEDRAEAHHIKPGHIRLQAHSCFVQYRNVWAKDTAK